MLVDLHLHTTKSDGVWTPARLFDEVRARGLDLFSVTDHDCIDAYPVPADLRERHIAGLEVDSVHRGHTVHILAYGIEEKDSPLLRALSAQRIDRRRRMQSMVDRLNDLGIDIHIDHVVAQTNGNVSLGRPHLARALLARGQVGTLQEAFDRYIADNGEGYVSLRRLSAEQIIKLTHQSKGVAVVAHPMRLHESAHLEELVSLGADGIEVIHPTANADDEAMLRELATRRGLLVSGGTDFHQPVADRAIGVEMVDPLARVVRSSSTRPGDVKGAKACRRPNGGDRRDPACSLVKV